MSDNKTKENLDTIPNVEEQNDHFDLVEADAQQIDT